MNNTRHGVVLELQSVARMAIGTTLSSNAFDGLHCEHDSAFRITGITIMDNGGDGIDLDDCSAVVSGSTISGNGDAAIEATFGSRLTLNGNTIGGPITCDGTVLSRGDAVCP